MIRWLRLVTVGVAVATMIALGVIAGLFLVANDRWVAVQVPARLVFLLGERLYEIWLPALIAGWLATAVLLVILVLGSLSYVWRRRQNEALIVRLERELTKLRNLPFTEPAPLEDLPEEPDAEAAKVMASLDDDDQPRAGERGGG